MQKFVPGCLVRVILNERSRSTQLDPKLMFWCVFLVWVHLEPFCNCTKLGAKRARLVQLMQKFVPRCLVGIFHKERSQSTPLDPKLLFWCISFLVGFGTVSLQHKTCCKTRQTGAINAKVCAMMSCQNLCNDRSRSTPLDPKLMFWCVSFRLGTFVTVSLLHETWCNTRQTGAVNVKVLATKSCHNFSQ